LIMYNTKGRMPDNIRNEARSVTNGEIETMRKEIRQRLDAGL
jgi:hypothetical protein